MLQKYLDIVKANVYAILDEAGSHNRVQTETQPTQTQPGSTDVDGNGLAEAGDAPNQPEAPGFDLFTHPGQYLTRKIRHDTYEYVDPLAAAQNMSGKYVFIASASGVIGTRTAVAFARAGVSGIALTARSNEKLDEVEKAVLADTEAKHNTDLKILKVLMDVSDSESITRAAEVTRAAFGKLDTIVNLAAQIDAGFISSIDVDEWWRPLETNVRGSYLVIRALLPLLGEAKEGEAKVIINSVSFSAHHAFPLSSGYHVSNNSASSSLVTALMISPTTPFHVLIVDKQTRARSDE